MAVIAVVARHSVSLGEKMFEIFLSYTRRLIIMSLKFSAGSQNFTYFQRNYVLFGGKVNRENKFPPISIARGLNPWLWILEDYSAK